MIDDDLWRSTLEVTHIDIFAVLGAWYSILFGTRSVMYSSS